MKTYITSDLHFGHQNIMRFCPATRAHYQSIDHMNEQMIRDWNDVVTSEDTVYILGDVAFMPAQKAAETVNRLNGTKILIEGNHDRKLLNDITFRRCFKEIHKYLDIVYNGNKIIMFHYPIAEWDQMHRGSVHFHGHLHGGVSGLEKFRCRDAGMDSTGRVVTSIDTLLAQALKGEIKGHH